MHAFWLNLSLYGPAWLASAGIVAAGALVACLSHVAQSPRGHVGRVGLQPVRIEVPPSRTPTVLSVRTLDAATSGFVPPPRPRCCRVTDPLEGLLLLHDASAHSPHHGEIVMLPDETRTPAAPPHEFAALEHILLGDLRDLLDDDPSDPETRRWLTAVLDVLADMLPCQFALEEHGGYLEDVRLEFPEWEGDIDRLHRQHEELYQGLCELRGQLADDDGIAASASRVRVDLRNWMEQLQSHQQAELDLLQSAANQETGVGG